MRKSRRFAHAYRAARRDGRRLDGVRTVAHELRSQWTGWVFDRRYGVETRSWVALADLATVGTSQVHGKPYEPTKTEHFKDLHQLDLPHQGGFVDLGSGKGLPLMMAVLEGFMTVTGVEFSPELCAISGRNLDSFRRTSGLEFTSRVLCQDAADFHPADDDLVFFLFNPFGDEVLAQVLANIETSVRRKPRRVHLAYHGAFEAHVIEASDRWSRVGQVGSIVHYSSP